MTKLGDLTPEQRALLARRLRAANKPRTDAGPPPLVPTARDGAIEASFGQQRFWVLAQLDERDAYDMSLVFRIGGVLEVSALARALEGLVARHEVLRTTFAEIDGLVVQRIGPARAGVLEVIDAGSFDAAYAFCHAAVRRPYDLTTGPLFEAVLMRLGAEDHVLLLRMHHIVRDEWSAGVLWRDLDALYQGRVLPALPVQYADFAAWQRRWLEGDVLAQQLTYWRGRLIGAEPLELPTDRPRPAVLGTRGAMLAHAIPAHVGGGMEALGRTHGTTPFMTWLAAYYVLLYRYSHQTDLSVGTPVAHRGRAETDAMIGYFVNTLVLRADLANNPRFTDLLAQVRDVALGAYAHQEAPFERVVEALRVPRDLARTPLFQTMFVVNRTEAEPTLAGLEVQGIELPHEVSAFDLTWFVEQGEDKVVFHVEYNTDLFDRSTIERMMGHYQQLVEGILVDATQTIGALPILNAHERQKLLVDWNATARDYPRDTCLHELVEAQVDRSPEAIALVLDGSELTYQELDTRANQLAHHLIALGAGPEVKVGVFVERSIEMVIGILGILKAGAAYVPLETKAPADRLAFILADASATLLVTQDRMAAQRDGLEAQCVRLDGDAASIAARPTTRPRSGVGAEHLAYVIYTSGSTGRPKGVQIEHRQIVNLVTASGAVEGIEATDRVLQFSSIAFDSSVEELFTPLLHGATMVLRGEEVPSALELFGALYAGVTVMNMATAYWHAIAAALEGHALTPPAELRMINIGGERALPDYLRRWHALLPGCALNNQYGPTETTVMATAWRLDRDQLVDGREVPIGRPLPNYTVYVLDARGELVPVGVDGELYIGGESVARGYLNRPALTAEKFVPNPFGPGRLYRTGDLVRWRADGNLEFVGRVDDQVKIRGFRIELGEIEALFAEHPAVQNVAVLARPLDGGEKQLVAYVVLGAAVAADELGAFVRSRLPAYMVPARLIVLDALPITATGKVNKAALPNVPGEALSAPRTYEPPQGELELQLADIWCELLGLPAVSRHDNFFELGGHSLLAMRMLGQLRRLGRTVEVRTLFATPTLSALASTMRSHREVSVPANMIAPGSTTITPTQLPLIDLTQADIDMIGAAVPGGLANVQDIYALAPLQAGILFHHQLAIEGDPYVVVQQFAFPDRALLDRYLSATQQVIDRHDIMRTAFVWEGLTTPAQVVLRRAPLVVTEVALDGTGPAALAQLVATFDPRQERLDLVEAPLLRYVIGREAGSERWLLLEISHHLIGDHESMELMRSEVELLLAGRTDALAAPHPFRNLVAAATLGVSTEAHEHYFRSLLGDVDEPSNPFGIADVHQDGGAMAEANQQLPRELATRLRAVARQLGISVATLCHVAWGHVVARTSGRTQAVFGTVLFGRMHVSNGDSALGLYMNTLPIRLDLGEQSVVATVRRAHAVLADLMANEHASLALAQRSSGVAPSTPLFSSLLNYRHFEAAPESTDESHRVLQAVEWLGGEERTNYPFVVAVNDQGGALSLNVQVVDSISPGRVCAMLARALEELAHALEHTPDQPVRALDILPPSERQQILVEWNATAAAYPADQCLHELFEAQVDRTPHAVAVVCEGSQLTFKELDERANALAHRLIALGVMPGEYVATLLERGTGLVIAQLGILKAGAA
ncbi:MAG: amino acid adenylation domain-containing protein, partial [Kofleriaceae bacterium]|nr:amino acid adenylation domain-containing protein [Kofleriaceae bacterium]